MIMLKVVLTKILNRNPRDIRNSFEICRDPVEFKHPSYVKSNRTIHKVANHI